MHVLKNKKVLKRIKKEQNKFQNDEVNLYVLAWIENQDKLNHKKQIMSSIYSIMTDIHCLLSFSVCPTFP